MKKSKKKMGFIIGIIIFGALVYGAFIIIPITRVSDIDMPLPLPKECKYPNTSNNGEIRKCDVPKVEALLKEWWKYLLMLWHDIKNDLIWEIKGRCYEILSIF